MTHENIKKLTDSENIEDMVLGMLMYHSLYPDRCPRDIANEFIPENRRVTLDSYESAFIINIDRKRDIFFSKSWRYEINQ